MQHGQPSSTAQNTALARAWLTRAGILDDPYAHLLLDCRHARIEEAAWRGRWSTLGQRAFAWIAARTRFHDALITHGLDAGIGQVVVVAAGYDSRAWRLARPGVRFFEVDHPATQADKRARAPADGPVYVAADLSITPLAEALLAADFRPSEPAVICCEGLTMYLEESAVRALLAATAQLCADGSMLGVDFAAPSHAARGPHRALRLLSRLVVRASGEPIISGVEITQAPELMADAGWTAEEVLDARAVQDRYLADDELPRRFRFTGASCVSARPAARLATPAS